MTPRTSRDWISVLWPSFVAACLVEMVVFASFDPQDWHFFGMEEQQSAETVYSIGFFCFWIITTLASLGTWNLTRSATELNRLTAFDAPRAGPGVPGPAGPDEGRRGAGEKPALKT